MNITKRLGNSLEDTLKILYKLESEGIQICRCRDNFTCQFCEAKKAHSDYNISIRQNIGLANLYKKLVYCETTGEWFKNFSQAGKHYDIASNSIAKNCYGVTHSAGKLNGKKLVWSLKRKIDKNL